MRSGKSARRSWTAGMRSVRCPTEPPWSIDPAGDPLFVCAATNPRRLNASPAFRIFVMDAKITLTTR